MLSFDLLLAGTDYKTACTDISKYVEQVVLVFSHTTCMIIVQFANIYMFTVTAQMIYLPFCVRQTRYRKVSPRGSFVFEKFRVSSEARVCAYSRIKKP